MRFFLKPLAILLIRLLQRRYKYISVNNLHNQTNQILAKLKLIQSALYFFKSQFNAWGYFHPDCAWSDKDERFYRKIFPQKDFQELDIVVWYNPAAVTYYHNEIDGNYDFSLAIEEQLKEWNEWN